MSVYFDYTVPGGRFPWRGAYFPDFTVLLSRQGTRATHIVHEPDHFLVPKRGTNSSHAFCKDHTPECFKSLTGPLYMMIQSMEMSTQVHNNRVQFSPPLLVPMAHGLIHWAINYKRPLNSMLRICTNHIKSSSLLISNCTAHQNN